MIFSDASNSYNFKTKKCASDGAPEDDSEGAPEDDSESAPEEHPKFGGFDDF